MTEYFIYNDIEFSTTLSADGWYQDILEKVHPHIHWIHRNENGYEGEYASLGYDMDSDEYTFYSGYFGSCSYCDMLEGCESEEDARAILVDMHKKVIRKKTKSEMIEYLEKECRFNFLARQAGVDKLIDCIDELTPAGVITQLLFSIGGICHQQE